MMHQKSSVKNIDAQDNATCLLSKSFFPFHKFSQGKIYAKASNTTHEGYQYCALEFDDAIFKEMEL